jgi:hypothetical protein
MNTYRIKLNLTRLTFVVLVASCGLLFKAGLTDYIILISVLIIFGGLFSTSNVELTKREIKFRKSYFWGLFEIKKSLSFNQVTSIKSKMYDLETHEGVGLLADNILTSLTLEFFKPRVKWMTTKLYYQDKGIEKDIELKMSQDNFEEIERGTKHWDQ